MKIVFMGTPDFAVPTLTEIVAAGHEVVAVYTRAPKPAGRGQAERKSPVHVAAERDLVVPSLDDGLSLGARDPVGGRLLGTGGHIEPSRPNPHDGPHSTL